MSSSATGDENLTVPQLQARLKTLGITYSNNKKAQLQTLYAAAKALDLPAHPDGVPDDRVALISERLTVADDLSLADPDTLTYSADISSLPALSLIDIYLVRRNESDYAGSRDLKTFNVQVGSWSST